MYHQYNEIIEEKKRDILECKIKGVASMVYMSYMVRDDLKESQKQLKNFDGEIKEEYPEVYKIIGELKRVKVLRKMNFHCFSLICRFSKK